jgi:hypothetical protein
VHEARLRRRDPPRSVGRDAGAWGRGLEAKAEKRNDGAARMSEIRALELGFK